MNRIDVFKRRANVFIGKIEFSDQPDTSTRDWVLEEIDRCVSLLDPGELKIMQEEPSWSGKVIDYSVESLAMRRLRFIARWISNAETAQRHWSNLQEQFKENSNLRERLSSAEKEVQFLRERLSELRNTEGINEKLDQILNRLGKENNGRLD